jgi:CxC6 like cysteine cluster associated with KDZ transposases
MTARNHASSMTEKCQVVVTDRITLGHVCCGVFRCTRPLIKNSDRFCPAHGNMNNICAIIDCQQPARRGSKTCTLPEHQAMEQKYYERGQAAFTLTQRLQRHRALHLDDTATGPGDVEEEVEWFEVNENHQVSIFTADNPGSVGVSDEVAAVMDPCDSKSPTGNRKLKACFGRRRTHNEQTLVRPCGIIVARATFFGAEAVSNVLVCYRSYASPMYLFTL